MIELAGRQQPRDAVQETSAPDAQAEERMALRHCC